MDASCWPLVLASTVLALWAMHRYTRWISLRILRLLPDDLLPRFFLALYYLSKACSYMTTGIFTCFRVGKMNALTCALPAAFI